RNIGSPSQIQTSLQGEGSKAFRDRRALKENSLNAPPGWLVLPKKDQEIDDEFHRKKDFVKRQSDDI
ncbi:MAG: hypothetical protein M1113_00320, partial [Candidatus Thermoplasmatota archaeon]|nr:hypothetical protein [Candidatus Thermoplasmatota archaeon]